MHATMLLTNARIYTQDTDCPAARAVALAGNRILAAVSYTHLTLPTSDLV
mgnify:CR=1 FL=1